MKSRLNLAVSQSVKDRIDALQKEIGADTMTEVVRRAIIAYEWLVQEQKEGNKIAVVRNGKVVEVILES